MKDEPEGLGMDIGQALASPTRTSAPFLKALYSQAFTEVSGVIHCTGGGQTKVKKFGSNNLYVKDNLFPTPKLFSLIQQSGQVPWNEMYQVFNMGHRMEVYIKCGAAEAAIKLAKSFGIEAKVVGRVEKSEGGNSVLVKGEHGEFRY